MSETILGGMMTVGNTYMFINSADISRTLRVWCDGSYPAGNLSNVCLWERNDSDTTQQWTLVNSGGHYLLKPVVNSSKALDLYTGSGDGSNYNAQLYTPSNTSWLSFEPAANYKVHIRLESNSSKYLTANQNSSGTRTGIRTKAAGNVYFWEGGLTDGSQEWIVREVSAGQGSGDTGAETQVSVGQMVTDFPSYAYYSSVHNVLYPAYVGECTWYCLGRAYEKKGTTGLPACNAGNWYSTASGFNKSSTPVANSIGCYGGGHVVYVEKVSIENGATYVYFSESNYYSQSDSRRGNTQIETLTTSPAGTDGVLKKVTLSAFIQRSPGNYQGCIIL